MADVLDVLIVGGGAAGYTAGIFAARDRCRALLRRLLLHAEAGGATGKTAAVPASGVFTYAGLTPNSELLGSLVPLDERGQIVTDLRMRTRVPGLLAAATAALAAVQYFRDGRWPA